MPQIWSTALLEQCENEMQPGVSWPYYHLPKRLLLAERERASPSPGGEGWGEGEPFSDFSAMVVRSRCTPLLLSTSQVLHLCQYTTLLSGYSMMPSAPA